MSKYKTHTTFNIFFALPLILVGIVYFFNPSFHLLLTFSLCFVYDTLYMNPDMDIANKIKLLSIKGLLTLPFRGYSLIFKHRGLSHWFILGSITRILWLGSFFYIILFLLNKSFNYKNIFIQILENDYFLYGFFAIVLADFCHLILDGKRKIKIKF